MSASPPDSAWTDSALAPEPLLRGLPFSRQRLLLLVAIVAGAAVAALALALARWPTLPLTTRVISDGRPALVVDTDPTRHRVAIRMLRAIRAEAGPAVQADPSLLPHSARWIVADADRSHRIGAQDALARLLQHPRLTLVLDDGQEQTLAVEARALSGLGLAFWALSAVAVVLCVSAAFVVLTRRNAAAAMYALLMLAQAGNLLLIAVETVPELGWPPGYARLDLALRSGLDFCSAAALLSVCVLASRRLAHARAILAAVWTVALGFAAALAADALPYAWWSTQAMLLAYGGGAIVALRLAAGREPRPYTALMGRLTIAAGATFALLTAATAASQAGPPAASAYGLLGPLAWTLFFVALLLLVPFVVRMHAPARELALLAGALTLAASLQLLLESLSGLGQTEALALALFLAALGYASSRAWLLGQLAGAGAAPSGERTFESLYRAARDIEHAPAQASTHLVHLLRELFDPVEITPLARASTQVRVSPDGMTLVVPLPRLPGVAEAEPEMSLRLRLAQRGTRLFTREDARLIDRVLEQLRRAVAFDHAVEHGRTEERLRIAQDLHDDIGARLLTLMYKSQDPEIEEYLRHTLQDLKTLTRGLAASSHRLSHAAAEWKADLTQRLNATQCELNWSFATDRDFNLSVTQWSALTRILRELVNNIIAHAQASEVEIVAVCERGRLTLRVCDDGVGRQPDGWSHGLGLGGVRKRVKALGGEVAWTERPGRGIRCEVRVPLRADAG